MSQVFYVDRLVSVDLSNDSQFFMRSLFYSTLHTNRFNYFLFSLILKYIISVSLIQYQYSIKSIFNLLYDSGFQIVSMNWHDQCGTDFSSLFFPNHLLLFRYNPLIPFIPQQISNVLVYGTKCGLLLLNSSKNIFITWIIFNF